MSRSNIRITPKMTKLDEEEKSPEVKAVPVVSSGWPNPTDLWTDLVETWKEMMGPAFDDDTTPAALAVKYRLESLKESDEILKNSQEKELREWAIQERSEALRELVPNFTTGEEGLILLYWQIRWERMTRRVFAESNTDFYGYRIESALTSHDAAVVLNGRSARLRAKVPALVAGLNGAFVLVFLRLALPRILAMQVYPNMSARLSASVTGWTTAGVDWEQSVGDVGEVATMFGLPGREELARCVAARLSGTPLVAHAQSLTRTCAWVRCRHKYLRVLHARACARARTQNIIAISCHIR